MTLHLAILVAFFGLTQSKKDLIENRRSLIFSTDMDTLGNSLQYLCVLFPPRNAAAPCALERERSDGRTCGAAAVCDSTKCTSAAALCLTLSAIIERCTVCAALCM